MRLKDLGLTVGDVDLGGFDAESDHGLTDHFVSTPIIKRIFNKNKHLVLGRKGSGKSALFRELPRIARETNAGFEVLPLTPDDYAWTALASYREQGLSLQAAHVGAWKLTLVVEIAAHLVQPNIFWHEDVRHHARVLSQFIRENFNDGGDLQVTRSLYKGVETFDLGALGFNVGVTRGKSPASRSPVTPAVTNALLEHVKVLLTRHPLLIELDRLDDAWGGSDEDKSLMIGLLKAVKSLNDSFARDSISSKIVAFLRTDIYDSLIFDERDKQRQGEERITWTAENLRELVNARLPKGVTTDELFEPGFMRGRSAPFDHMLRRTFFRPREVLQYLQLVLEAAGDEHVQVWKEDVTSSEPQFSNWKVQDLKQEYFKAVPELTILIEALRQQVSPFQSVEALELVLTEKASEVAAEKGARACAETLWNAAVIGARLNGTGAIRFKSTDPTFSMPVDGVIYVHQGLTKGLNITERRSSGAADGDPE